MNNSNLPTRDKVMLALALLADSESGKYVKLNRHKTEIECRKIINMALQEEEISSQIGKWNCLNVWILNVAGEARNTTMVFENEAQNELVIGVAGTNFVNKYDWFVEDVKTSKLVPWNNGIVHRINLDTEHRKGYVSEGASIALKNNWNLKDTIFKGVKLHQWLKHYLSKNRGINSIAVTGHSLGGAISPTLTQALSDHRDKWSNANDIQLASYIYAGPTPGDKDFVNYVAQGDVSIYSTYNTMDVVPHAWNLDMINQIPDLYEPYMPSAENTYGNIVLAMVEWIRNKSKTALENGHLYERWSNEQTFNVTVPTNKIPEHKIMDFVDVIITDLIIKKESRESLCRICGIATVDELVQINELRPFLMYFAKFLLVLRDQHVLAYFEQFENKAFEVKLKEYLGNKTMSFFGMRVLNELFKEIGAKSMVAAEMI